MNLARSARRLLRLLPVGLLVLAASLGASHAHAAAEIRVVDVEFIPASITLGATSTLRVALRNNGAGGQRASIDYWLTVPAGLAVHSHQLGQDCNAAAVSFMTDDTQSGVLKLIGLTLLPSGTCTVDLSVSAAVGQYTFEEAENANPPLSATLTVTAPAVPEAAAIAVSPTTVPFPPQEVGFASAARLVTVSNPAGVALDLQDISVSGPFAVTRECPASLLPAGACTLTVTFTPTATGPAAGSIQITSNAPTASIDLSGEGIAPLPSLSPAGPLLFGDVAVDSSATTEVTLRNSLEATAALAISGISASGAFSASHDCPESLGVGDACTITVSFTPDTAGVHDGLLTVGTSASTFNLALSGSAIALPVLAVSPASLDFGLQTINVPSATQQVTVTNAGTANLEFTASVASGDEFTFTTGCPMTLAPGATCTLAVTFLPTALGPRNGRIDISSNASEVPRQIALAGTGTAAAVPAIAMTPASGNLGAILVGTTSSARFVLSSAGQADLSIAGISVAGAHFGQSNTCPPVLAPGAACEIEATYAPTVAGSHAGELRVTSNAVPSPLVMPLSGSALAVALPALAVSPASLDYGSQTINVASTTQPVTVKNEGAANLYITSIVASGDFNFIGCPTPITLAPGASCTLDVKFLPTALGPRGGWIDISSNASDVPQDVVLAGSGTQAPVPAIAITPSSANLGAILVGATSTARFVLSSTGQADLSIAGISVAGAHFGQSNTCPPVLAPGAACEIEATYAPTVAGSHAGELRVASNAVPSPLVMPLTGSALAGTGPALVLSMDRLAFGPSFVSLVSSPGMITVTNAGTGPMHIASIATEGDFGYSGCGFPSTLLPGESCALWITFRPLSEGPVVGRMQVFSDAPGSPHAIALSGTGALTLSPQIDLTPSAHHFGTLGVGEDEVAPMRLTNVGNMALTISAISTAGASFSQASSCPASLAPGASCDIEVAYAPGAAGAHSGQLRIDSNATPARHVAALSGTATPVPPPFMVVARVVDFGQQVTRSAARATLDIRNSGGLPLVITGMQFFGASVFGVEGSCGAVAPKGRCSLTLLFAPTAAGAMVGRMEIASNHSRGVVVVELVGQGVRSPHPDLELSVEGLGFGNQVIGSLGDQRVVGLANVGSLPLQLLGFDASVDFLVDSSRCPAQLQPDESCEVRVTFKPVAPGPRGGELAITSNAIGAPHAVSLTGTGCRFFTMRAARSAQRLCAP